MTAPIVTPETTLRELGELLERAGYDLEAAPADGGWWVSVSPTVASVHAADLATAISLAIAAAKKAAKNRGTR